ncbi:hypothetical protein B0H14DRAFT_3150824 [Mycena olivaceomarginata]|nr:hypothetical protein B0H14DRAFT_3150824 [Mycena olivaceomarginata]
MGTMPADPRATPYLPSPSIIPLAPPAMPPVFYRSALPLSPYHSVRPRVSLGCPYPYIPPNENSGSLVEAQGENDGRLKGWRLSPGLLVIARMEGFRARLAELLVCAHTQEFLGIRDDRGQVLRLGGWVGLVAPREVSAQRYWEIIWLLGELNAWSMRLEEAITRQCCNDICFLWDKIATGRQIRH